MTAISEREAKTQYLIWKSIIIGYSLKVASTTIFNLTYGSNRYKRARALRIGQQEAFNSNKDIHLFVRHPLDRLVSAYLYFTKIQNSYIKPILDISTLDHDKIMGNGEYSNINLEEWYKTAIKYYNPHWEPQWDYHTTKNGELVPNKLWPIEALELITPKSNVSPRIKKSWEEYYSSTFRNEIENKLIKDIKLYNKAQEIWKNEGRSAPQIF